MENKKVAVVTGGARGIGLEVCRQLAARGMRVFLTARDENRARPGLGSLAEDGELRDAGGTIEFLRLDVASAQSIRDFARQIEQRAGGVDVLVNNAGILLDDEFPALEVDPTLIRETFETNTLGPFLLSQALIPLMKRRRYGRIVNVSSGMGQLSEMGGGYAAYRLSKAALNAVTRIFAAETRGQGILVNSVAPGWVRTEMGGASAPLGVEQGAETIVWAATLPADGPSGGFFEEKERMDW